MREIEQLKKRIINSKVEGVLTAEIREDYDPVGERMIQRLLASNEFVSRRTPAHSFDSKWRVFKKGMEPY